MHTLRIVVIEDNQPTAEMIQDFLKTNFPKAETILFSSGEEAIERITWKPDLFIIDYHLNSVNSRAMDGIKVMMKLKDEHDAPVIFLSSQEDATVSANTIKYGADDYVAKNNQEAFNRLEIAIGNVLHNTYLQRDIIKQRRFVVLLAFLVFTLITGIMLTKFLS